MNDIHEKIGRIDERTFNTAEDIKEIKESLKMLPHLNSRVTEVEGFLSNTKKAAMWAGSGAVGLVTWLLKS